LPTRATLRSGESVTFELEGWDFEECRRCSELSVKYLLDPAGRGWPKSGIHDSYVDARNGVPCSRSFQDHMAIGLQECEDQYWDLMCEYLRGRVARGVYPSARPARLHQ
jgi:hypothetical protein